MNSQNRILSIDIMRGLTLFLMLFVNDLNIKIAPSWLGHMNADFNGMGLADWVFPGFLFIAGMSIPFAFSKRLEKNESLFDISKHILVRFISLIIIGVLMLNTERVEPILTGIGKNMWALLMYLGVFLFWNDYPKKDERFLQITSFKLIGLAILVLLVFIFRSGEPENNGSLITGWWGIPGLIGWGYLVTAFTYLVCRDSILKTSVILIIFLVMNMLSGWNMFGELDPLKPFLGVLINGNVPFIVLTGLIGGLIIKRFRAERYLTIILIFIGLGIISIAAGFILRHWFIISKIQGTPSWAMICNGISFLMFALIFWISDVKKRIEWTLFLKPAGENSLTTYLAPDILYYMILMSGIPVLIYKQSHNPWIAVTGSLVWAFLMIGLAALLSRFNIRLRI